MCVCVCLFCLLFLFEFALLDKRVLIYRIGLYLYDPEWLSIVFDARNC